jgi:hypothetical protein
MGERVLKLILNKEPKRKEDWVNLGPVAGYREHGIGLRGPYDAGSFLTS